jgi:hypothetical protein
MLPIHSGPHPRPDRTLSWYGWITMNAAIAAGHKNKQTRKNLRFLYFPQPAKSFARAERRVCPLGGTCDIQETLSQKMKDAKEECMFALCRVGHALWWFSFFETPQATCKLQYIHGQGIRSKDLRATVSRMTRISHLSSAHAESNFLAHPICLGAVPSTLVSLGFACSFLPVSELLCASCSCARAVPMLLYPLGARYRDEIPGQSSYSALGSAKQPRIPLVKFLAFKMLSPTHQRLCVSTTRAASSRLVSQGPGGCLCLSPSGKTVCLSDCFCYSIMGMKATE